MYTIFINDSVLILSSLESVLEFDEQSEIQIYSCDYSMNSAINKVQNGLCKSLILRGNDVEYMWRHFCSYYQLIEAAGGVVVNSKREVLWIKRNGKWDLPKGKVESGEKVEDAAVREVEEECTVRGISRGALLGVTYHTYSYMSKAILKKTYWYEMTCSSKQVLKPQLEEGITEVIWADKKKHFSCLSNTFTSIVELLKQEKVVHYLCS